MNRIYLYLKKPYPLIGDFKKSILNNFLVGVFVASFLIFFQPFGTQAWKTDYKTLKLLGFGFISFVVPSILEWLITRLAKQNELEEKWTVGKEILSILLILAFIALGNLLYSHLLGTVSISFGAYFTAFVFTCVIGIFPVTLHVILKHNKLLKINLEQTLEINKQLSLNQSTNSQDQPENDSANIKALEKDTLSFIAENEKDFFNIHINQLLFIESADNYSSIVYAENKILKKQLLRSSLKRMESQVTHPSVIRCHRTYIVNLIKVKKVEGNAAGYKLFFDECESFVPVSRNYVPGINQKLKKSD